jgi:peptide subunit release factor RF-3
MTVFKPANGGDWIVGVVGALQLAVLTARLAAEYDLQTRLDGAPFRQRAGSMPTTGPSSNASVNRAEKAGIRQNNPTESYK